MRAEHRVKQVFPLSEFVRTMRKRKQELGNVIVFASSRANKFAWWKTASNHGLNFKSRSDDVIVVTTWIVHELLYITICLLMICDVVSLIKQAYDLEIDFNAKHNYQPRCYKLRVHIVVDRHESCAAIHTQEVSLHEFAST